VVDPASPLDIELLRKSREKAIFNPYKAHRQGHAAVFGHGINKIFPTIGDAVLRGVAGVHGALDSVDIGAGNALAKAGVPNNWLATEESINLGHLPHGQSGVVPTKRIYVNRISTPLGRAAAIAGIASLGLWAKRKLLDSKVSTPSDNEDSGNGIQRVAEYTPLLTPTTTTSIVDAHKLASLVIDKQANLISELQTAHNKVAEYAAALAQAVKLAQDGAIDVSDVLDHARQLINDRSVKLSAADDVFNQSPGELHGERQQGTQEKLDPLTSFLRSRH
jgi:hypothetical protein